jgi:hypothetical protein
VGECSEERSQPIPELADGAQESKSYDKAVAEGCVLDIVSSCSSNSNVPRDAPFPSKAPMLPKPEPDRTSRAQSSHPTHRPEAPYKAEVFSARRPQVGHKTAVLQSPGLLDTVVVLVRAHLAARSACDKFGLQDPKGPPDKPLVMGEEQYSYDIINKINIMGTMYSLFVKAVLSLLGSAPVAPSQAPAPSPGFNRHKPSSLLEGEGQLDKAVVSKINKASAMHSLKSETALAPFIPESHHVRWGLSNAPSSSVHIVAETMSHTHRSLPEHVTPVCQALCIRKPAIFLKPLLTESNFYTYSTKC